MWDRDDWVLPTYLNEPYLKKPPGFYWAVRIVSIPFGEVTHWSLRLTSALGVLGGAVLITWWGQEWVGAGLAVGLAYLITPEVWTKGMQGEIDALFSVQILVAAYSFWKSTRVQSGLRWALGSGLLMAWAILTKGPIALLFFYLGFGLWLLWENRLTLIFARLHVAFLFAAVFPVLIWVVLLTERVPFQDLLTLWGLEMGQTRAAGSYWIEARRILVFPVAVILAYLPGFFRLGEIRLAKPLPKENQSLWRFALAFSVPMSFLLLLHGRRVRYTLPGGSFLPLLWAIPIADRPPLIQRFLGPKTVAIGIFTAGLLHSGVAWWDSRTNAQCEIADAINPFVDEREILLTDLDGDYIGLPFYLNGLHKEIAANEEVPNANLKILTYSESARIESRQWKSIVTVDPPDGPSLTLFETGDSP